MANIPVSVQINTKGDITCPDTSGAAVGDTISWQISSAPGGGDVTTIVPGRPSPFTAPPAISNGQWSATILASGSYTITDSQGKQKTPRISILTPMLEKKG